MIQHLRNHVRPRAHARGGSVPPAPPAISRGAWLHRLSTAAAGVILLGACSVPSQDAPADGKFTRRVHAMPLQDAAQGDKSTARGAAVTPAFAPAGAHLSYFGGKVIQNVRVTQVLYGAGTYIPELTSASGVNMQSAYLQMVASGAFDWLTEYNTSSPAQAIGRGSFTSSVQIAPAGSRDGQRIDDADIRAEIEAQINAGLLPPPDDNQLYMLHFPSGKTIAFPTPSGDSKSCVLNDPATNVPGFCAYHSTFQIGSQNVYYGVIPALTDGACPANCSGGLPFTTFQKTQVAASHELIEAVTDPEVGLANAIPGPPQAWFDPILGQTAIGGEIGDLCLGQLGTFRGSDNNVYTIQQEFSNLQGDCVTTPSLPSPPVPHTSDILWRNTSNTLTIWFMAGSTISSREVPATTSGQVVSPGPDWQIQGTGDFNGDGESDILWRNSDGTALVWMMSGSTILSQPVLATPAGQVVRPGSDWQIQGTGDFNGDGLTDILWRNTDGTALVWTMSGTTILSQLALATPAGEVIRPGPEWQIQGTGDFNADGHSDIVWRNTNGTVQLWLMSGTTILSRPNLPVVPGSDWQIQGVGDFNANGTSDILWRNTSGAVAIWSISGGALASQLFPYLVTDSSWQIKGVGMFDP